MTDDYKMILADGTEIILDAVNLPLHIVLTKSTRAGIIAVWDTMTAEALVRVTFICNGDTLFTFINCVVDGEQIIANQDGTYTGHYYLSGEREVYGETDTDLETAARILLGEGE